MFLTSRFCLSFLFIRYLHRRPNGFTVCSRWALRKACLRRLACLPSKRRKTIRLFFSNVPLFGDTLRRAIHAAEKRGEILKCGWKNSFLWGWGYWRWSMFLFAQTRTGIDLVARREFIAPNSLRVCVAIGRRIAEGKIWCSVYVFVKSLYIFVRWVCPAFGSHIFREASNKLFPHWSF